MKEKILELLNSSNINDVILGILLTKDNNLWKEFSKPFEREVVDSSIHIKYPHNKFSRIIYKGEAFCIEYNIIHRYKEYYYPIILEDKEYIIYTDNSIQ